MVALRFNQNWFRNSWEKTEPGLGLGRDPWRTPFQWNNSTNAGFTKGRPWLPLDPDYRLRNAEELKKDPTSILCFYKQLIELRRHCRAVNSGTYRSIGVQSNIFAYERCNGDDRIIIALNMGMESLERFRSAWYHCGIRAPVHPP